MDASHLVLPGGRGVGQGQGLSGKVRVRRADRQRLPKPVYLEQRVGQPRPAGAGGNTAAAGHRIEVSDGVTESYYCCTEALQAGANARGNMAPSTA